MKAFKGLVFIVGYYAVALIVVRERDLLLPFVLPCAPLILYSAVAPGIRKYLKQPFPDRRYPELEKKHTASLTLAGFCFTSLSLLLSFFKDRINTGDTAPAGIVFFFCFALATFIASHLILRYRMFNIFDYLSDAFIDNGFWCVLLGLWTFFRKTPGMQRSSTALAALLLLYVAYLFFHLWFQTEEAKREAIAHDNLARTKMGSSPQSVIIIPLVTAIWRSNDK